MNDPIKTWSIVADKMGGHWHCRVRRGIEGSRALLGELTFDLSDAENLKQQIEYAVDRVVVRIVSRTIAELTKDQLLRLESDHQWAELQVKYDEIIMPECRALVLTHLAKQFGWRVNFAQVTG